MSDQRDVVGRVPGDRPGTQDPGPPSRQDVVYPTAPQPAAHRGGPARSGFEAVLAQGAQLATGRVHVAQHDDRTVRGRGELNERGELETPGGTLRGQMYADHTHSPPRRQDGAPLLLLALTREGCQVHLEVIGCRDRDPVLASASTHRGAKVDVEARELCENRRLVDVARSPEVAIELLEGDQLRAGGADGSGRTLEVQASVGPLPVMDVERRDRQLHSAIDYAAPVRRLVSS